MALLRTASILALAALGSGCSLANAPGDHQRPIPASEFCVEYARVVCRAAFECCPNGPPTDPAIDTFEECERANAIACGNGIGRLALDPRTGYSAEHAARVVHEGNSYIDRCDLAILEWSLARDGFQSILQGTVPGGQRCDTPSAEDFAPLFSCIERDQSCIANAPSSFSCQALRREGDICLLTFDCEPGLYCPGLLDRCTRRLPIGASCANDGACESLVCSKGRCVERTPEAVFCGIADSPA